MKKFLNKLEKEAKKHFSKEETNEVVSYYEEIINDRISNNENLEEVLKDYDIKIIVKNMIPEIISKRDFKNHKNIFKSFWQLLLIMLFTAPILIPLAILYLVLIIVFAAITLSGIVVMFSGVIAFVPYFIEVIVYSNSIGTIIGLSGIGIIGVSIVFIIGYFFTKGIYTIIKYMIKGFSSLITRKQARQ